MFAPERSGPSIELWITLQKQLVEKERQLGGIAREVAAGRQTLETLRAMDACIEGDREVARVLLWAMRDAPE